MDQENNEPRGSQAKKQLRGLQQMIPQRKLSRRWPALGCFAMLMVSASTSSPAREVSFNRDIRPLLSDRCFSCHGPDTENRKAKLRLDLATGKEGAYRSRGGSAALKPGDLGKSELWRRITTADEDDVMPPPKAKKKPLSKEGFLPRLVCWHQSAGNSSCWAAAGSQ